MGCTVRPQSSTSGLGRSRNCVSNVPAEPAAILAARGAIARSYPRSHRVPMAASGKPASEGSSIVWRPGGMRFNVGGKLVGLESPAARLSSLPRSRHPSQLVEEVENEDESILWPIERAELGGDGDALAVRVQVERALSCLRTDVALGPQTWLLGAE